VRGVRTSMREGDLMPEDVIGRVRAAYGAAQRSYQLAVGLDQSARPGDLVQVAAGIVHELRATVEALSCALEALEGLPAAVLAQQPGQVRQDARDTSRAAARGIAVRTGSQRARILQYLLSARGARTDLEIQTDLSMAPNSERPRRGELVDLFLVAPAGERQHRGTVYTTWQLTPTGDFVARRLDVIGARRGSVDVPMMPPAAPSAVDVDPSDPVLF
jgi:hypothetical protein